MSFIVKNTTFLNPLDLIAPHTCRGCGELGSVLCERCKNYIKTSQKLNAPIITIGRRKGILEILIHDLKYNSVRAAAVPLAELIADAMPALKGKVVIVPLPTISRHVRARGLDHTKLVAKHLAKIKGYKVSQLLIRNKNTVQVGSDRKTRLAQAKTAYALKNGARINPSTTYILLDDVWTTGASMRAAKAVLKKAGAKNIIITVLSIS